MKTFHLVPIIFLFVFCSCNSPVKTNAQKVTFGIHEVLNISQIPQAITDTLKTMNMQLEKNPRLSILGYLTQADLSALQLDLSKEHFRLLRILYPVDKDKKYYAIVPVNPEPAIDISDIKSTKNKGKGVEIYFTMKGARKWADLTRKSIGKNVAFVIDSQVYSMPLVNGEITGGVALINGLENEAFAKQLSESLNASIPE